MVNAIVRIATPKTGLKGIDLRERPRNRLGAAAYHFLRTGANTLYCTQPSKRIGQSREASVSFFHERGIHSIKLERKAALTQDEFIQLLTIMYAATEMPQALLSNEWVQDNGIEVQMQKGQATAWQTVTLDTLPEFIQAQALAEVAKEAPVQPTATAKEQKSAPTTTKYKINKAQKSSLKYFAGSALLLGVDLLAALVAPILVAPIPYLVVWSIGALACIVNAFSIVNFLRASISNYLNYRGKGILEINEEIFKDPVALRQGIMDLGLGRGIKIFFFRRDGNRPWKIDDKKGWEALKALLVEHSKIELDPDNIYEEIIEKGLKRQVNILCSSPAITSSSQSKLLTLKGLSL